MMSHRPNAGDSQPTAAEASDLDQPATKSGTKRATTRKSGKLKPSARTAPTTRKTTTARKATRARQVVLTPAPATCEDPVLRATYDSIMEVGVRRTTLVDVARRAGVSRMTVYRKYDDLPRLLSAVLTVELGSLLETARLNSAHLPDARSRLTSTVTDTVSALAAHPLLTRILSVDPETLVPFVVDRLGTTQQLALNQLRVLIAAGQSVTGDGSIRDGDPELLALTVLAFAQSFVFSARALANCDPLGRIYPELDQLTDRYLAPSAEMPKIGDL